MIVQCTTAELPTLLPMLAGLNHAFKLDVTDAPKARTETVAVPAAPVVAPAPVQVEPAPAAEAVRAAPVAPAAVAVTAGKARWYSTDEVGAIVGYSKERTIRLMKRAGIDVIRTNRTGKRGDTRNYYDADKVDALKRELDATWSVQDAADLMGDKSTVPIQYHTERRRITPTIVAGQIRYTTEDLQELMRYRKIA
ncbi:hypothetical protein [Burkholderia glumae]|uniref:hypothetical protein n=1 Tax=Burkholderia glumae TaxID=337 RepID=UPI0021503B3F|nr:hypothetical protein [Burkholderia glumae]